MIKQRLYSLRHKSKLIDTKLNQAAKLRQYYTAVKGFDYSKEKLTGGERKDFTDTVVKILDLEQEITKDIDELVNERKMLKKLVEESLTGTELNVIEMRYFDYLKWEEIAVQLKIDLSWVYRLHGRALEKLKK